MSETKKTSQATEAFLQYLQECNMRKTPERMAIIEVISRQKGLFSVDELHSMMSREAFPVTTATIYNTIEILTDAGLLTCVRLPDRTNAMYRLWLNNAHQVYLICERCGAIKETGSRKLAQYIAKYDFSTFRTRSFALSVYGLCRKCQKILEKQP